MIGGEGALVAGGFAAAVLATPMLGHVPPMPTVIVMASCSMIVGGFWVGLAGFLRYARGEAFARPKAVVFRIERREIPSAVIVILGRGSAHAGKAAATPVNGSKDRAAHGG